LIPTEELVHEHEVITHVLKSAAAQAGRLIDYYYVLRDLVMLRSFDNYTLKHP
jgi:hypothetical protein